MQFGGKLYFAEKNEVLIGQAFRLSHVAMTIISKSLMHAWRSHPKSPVFERSILGSSADRVTST